MTTVRFRYAVIRKMVRSRYAKRKHLSVSNKQPADGSTMTHSSSRCSMRRPSPREIGMPVRAACSASGSRQDSGTSPFSSRATAPWGAAWFPSGQAGCLLPRQERSSQTGNHRTTPPYGRELPPGRTGRPSRNRMTARMNDGRSNFGACTTFCVHQALGKSAHASKILDVSRTERGS